MREGYDGFIQFGMLALAAMRHVTRCFEGFDGI